MGQYLFKVFSGGILCLFLASCSQLAELGSRLLSQDGAIVNALVTGLAGSNLQLKINDEETVTINNLGKNEISAALKKGAAYNLAIVQQPVFPNQVCTIAEPSGVVGSVDFDISINCQNQTYTIGGTISGLAGSGLQLQLNASEIISPGGNGSFQFSGAIPDGSTFNVQVLQQPTSPAQICTPSFNNAPVLGENVTTVQVLCDTILYPVGGFVSGLNGSGLELQINGGNDLAVNNNGFFVFATPVADTAAYTVTVKTNPSGPVQTCSVSNGSGVVAGNGAFNVAVTCNTQAYSLMGNVTALNGAGLALLSSAGEIVTVNNPGPVSFNQAVSDGSPYFVKVFRQPTTPSENCTVANDSGTVAASDVTNIQVDCVTQSYSVGGTVADLSGSGLTLRLNGSEDLIISPGATSFTFNSTVSDGGNYLVEVVDQPQSPLEHCSIATPSGTIASANVSNVPVDCDPAFSVGGTVTGLLGSSLVLKNNGGDNLPISGNGGFTFGTGLLPSSAYAVTVANHPENAYQVCSVSGGSSVADDGTGTLPGASNYSGITINCSTITAQFASGSTSQNESVTSFNIPVNLTATTPRDVIINYLVSGGTAVNGVDYTIGSGSLLIPQGSSSGNITINVTDDAAFESDETVQVSLTGVFGATLSGTLSYTYTIQNNDAPPTVSFTSGNQSTGAESGSFTVTAQLSAVAGNNVTVPFSVNGSSTATGGGTDYSISGSPLVILAGQTSSDITVTVASDSLDEINETVVIDMGAPINANQGATTNHTITIDDDDSQPTVAFTTASQNSGGAESGTMLVTAQLSAPSGQTVTVPFTIDGASTATGSGTDYTITASPITINAGATTGSATITIQGEAIDEDDETVVINMGGPTNASASGIVSHTATINDDDNPPTVQFTAANQGSGTETGTMTITAQLSHQSSKTVTVPFTVNGSSTATGGGTDYSITSSPLTFIPLDTSEDITITINTDSTDEDDETVIVDIGSPTNATASGTTSHTATIEDDDNPPDVDFSHATSNSGGVESGTITITAVLSEASAKTVTMPFSVNGSSTATGGGADYTISSSPLTFTPGDTSEDITITIVTDSTFEGDETVVVDIGSPTNANASGTTTHTATIDEDDLPVDGPAITAAAYFDLDEDGYIDHARLTFDNNIDDSTFDGYLGSNNLGNVTTEFAIAGYNNIRIDTRDATVTDTDDDTIIWLAFDENTAAYDTGAKPDLTATDASLRGTAAGNCYIMTTGANCTTQADADIAMGDVTEADLAKPVVVAAWSDPIIDAWQLRIETSEAVDMVADAGCSGTVTSAEFTYTNTSGNGATALRTDFADNNGCDMTGSKYLIVPRVDSRFIHADFHSDTVALNTTMYDAADNQGATATKTIGYDSELELYYPMDAALGDTNSLINDVSGNSRNGDPEGDASLTTDMTGQSNQAYILDGDDRLSVATYAGETGDQARTFALWVKADTTGQLMFTGELGATAGAKFFFRINGTGSNGNLGGLTIDAQSGRLTSEQSVVGTGWHHLAVAYEGSGDDITDSKLYIDGRLVTSYSNSVAQAVNTFSGLGLTMGFNMRGKVDEARVYSRALTADEIKKLATKVPGGLVAHYPLDSDASDLTGGGRDGTAAGDAATTANDRYGRANSAFAFDGTGDWVTATIPEAPQGAAERTLCAWSRLPSGAATSGRDMLISYGANATDQRYELNAPNTSWSFDTSGNQLIGSSVTTDWVHLCAHYAANTKTFFVNGEAVNSNSRTLATSGTSFAFGVRWDLDTGTTLVGEISDIRIYNRALTAGEVAALATELDRGLVAYYPLDDNTTSTAAGAIKDYSGKNPNLTLTAGPVPTTDRFGNSGSAYLYNGTGKMESESTPTNLPVNDENRTACAWAASNASGSNFIMEYGGAAASNHIKYRITFENNFFQSDFRTGGTITSAVIAANNQWAHYCARFRNNNTNDIIVNGVIEGTVTGYTNAATAQEGFVIGANLFSDRFNGSIDDVRVYDRALSLTEIRELSGFHPGQLDEISLHLDAGRAVFNDAGTTLATNMQTVREWHDISFTNGTANGINVSQGTASDRPTWRQTVAAVNDMPVVRFDGADDYLSTSVTGTDVLSESEWSVFTVVMQVGTKAQNGVFSWGFDGFNRASLIATDNDSITFMGTRNGDPSGKSSAAQPAGWDDNYHTLYGYLDSANDGETNVDGTTIDSWTNMTYNPNFSANTTMSIGRDNTFAYYLEGDIAEVVLFKRALTQDERNQIVCYFSKKYSITVSTTCD